MKDTAQPRFALSGNDETGGREVTFELISKPRRRVEFVAKISADSWKELRHHLAHLSAEIARRGNLSKHSISGGYSTSHIIMTSEDETITHDSWAAELDAHLEATRAAEDATSLLGEDRK